MILTLICLEEKEGFERRDGGPNCPLGMCGRSHEGRLTKVIDSFFQATDYDTRVNFCDYLNFHGINPVFRETKDGRVYAITLVDYRRGSVINGRDRGNPYSGQALLKRFVAAPQGFGSNFVAGERERQECIDRGLEWPDLGKNYHSQASHVEDISREISNLMNAKKYYPDLVNPYLKRKKRKRYPL